jgi:hypothetical protein
VVTRCTPSLLLLLDSVPDRPARSHTRAESRRIATGVWAESEVLSIFLCPYETEGREPRSLDAAAPRSGVSGHLLSRFLGEGLERLRQPLGSSHISSMSTRPAAPGSPLDGRPRGPGTA